MDKVTYQDMIDMQNTDDGGEWMDKPTQEDSRPIGIAEYSEQNKHTGKSKPITIEDLVKLRDHEPNAGYSTCPICGIHWLVTPGNDCCVPSCGCFGNYTGPENPNRPCERCGIKHGFSCEHKPKPKPLTK